MKATATCTTCGGRLVGPASLLGALCPACLIRASTTPAPLDGATTWAEVFPQLEVQRLLREQDGVSIYLATVSAAGPGVSAAVLQVVAGAAYRRAGGGPGLTARSQRLASCGIEGLTPVLDFGDLADAFFLVTEAPSLPRLVEILDGRSPDEVAGLLRTATSDAEAMRAAGRRCGIPIGFDPDLCFVDEASGRVVQTPNLLPGALESSNPPLECFALSPGSRIGGFVLEKRIGVGGFGEVWRARQERPAVRQVAIKVLRSGVHSPRALARFEVEQQALARLDHPSIARFLDGGTTPDGRPYFAMEWVDGTTLETFVRQTQPPLAERLQLVGQACEAVHHAHQKGIIHRDLKSSNIMVCARGGQPTVKVIDFGIARALEEPLAQQTVLTRAEEILGTPAVMSPEQAAGAGGADLDARTDVYGLGVVLYELLTGVLPFAPTLPGDELRRRIREDDPPRPSSRIETGPESRELRGDLDWITMRCLEKDPERRYRSVSALLRDLERHADDEPVDAGPPKLSYRAGKFVRRNRAMVAGSLVAVVALLAGLLVALDGYRRASMRAREAATAQRTAEEEATTASEVTAFLKTHFFGQLDPSLNPTRGLTLEDAVHRAAVALDREPLDAPAVETEIRLTLAESLEKLARFPEAERQYRIASAMLADTEGLQSLATIDTLAHLARVLSKLGRHDEACAMQQEVVDFWRTRATREPEPGLRARRNLARYLIADHRVRDGSAIMQEVFDEQRDRFGIDHPETLETLAELSRYWSSWEKNWYAAERLRNDLDIPRIYREGSIEAILAVHRIDEIEVDEPDLEVLRSRIEGIETSGESRPVEVAMLRLEHALRLPRREMIPALRDTCRQLEAIVGPTHPSVLRGYRALIVALHDEEETDTIPGIIGPVLAKLEEQGLCFAEREQLTAQYACLTGRWNRLIRYYLDFADQLDLLTLRNASHTLLFTGDREGFQRIHDTLVERFGDSDDPYAATVALDCLLDGPLFDPPIEPDRDSVARLNAIAARQKPDWWKTRVFAMRSALLTGKTETANHLATAAATTDTPTYDAVDRFWTGLARAECAERRGDTASAVVHLRRLNLDWRTSIGSRMDRWRDLLPIAAAIDSAERRILGREPNPPRVSPAGFGIGPGAEDGWLADERRAADALREGIALALRNDPAAAIENFRRSASLLEGSDCIGHPVAVAARKNVVTCLRVLGRQEEMLEEARKVAGALREIREPAGERFLARQLILSGRIGEGATLLERQISQLESAPDPAPYEVLTSQLMLARCWRDLGRDSAASGLLSALMAEVARPSLNSRRLADAIRAAHLRWDDELIQKLLAELGRRQLAEIKDAREHPDDIAWRLLQTAAALAFGGSNDMHRELSRDMVRSLSGSGNSITEQRVWLAVLCLPPEDPALAHEAVRRLAASDPKLVWTRYWQHFTRGLASYRARDYAGTIEQLEKTPRPIRYARGTLEALHLLLEAMARQQSGDEERASQLLREVKALMPGLRGQHPVDSREPGAWQDILYCEILLREASGIVRIHEGPEAPIANDGSPIE